MKKKDTALHPSRSVHLNWTRRGGKKPKTVEKTQCKLFSDGVHRFTVSPAGVRFPCLCGAVR